MPAKVTDIRANVNENIVHAVKIIGKSLDRKNVFEAIYQGKKKLKTVGEIIDATGLTRVRVLQEAGVLFANQIVEKTKKDGETSYIKDDFYTYHKNRILAIVKSPQKASKYPTKQSPNVTSTVYKISVRSKKSGAQYITIDDIDSFALVRAVRGIEPSLKLQQTKEADIKGKFQRIIGESFGFIDWGGEQNDLFTTKLRIKRKRLKAAFAFKGRATTGVLVPRKMGKNGDQITRLCGSPADVYVVVYHSKIDESIIEQLKAAAVLNALSGRTIYYCTIDGDDLNRLYQAYSHA